MEAERLEIPPEAAANAAGLEFDPVHASAIWPFEFSLFLGFFSFAINGTFLSFSLLTLLLPLGGALAAGDLRPGVHRLAAMGQRRSYTSPLFVTIVEAVIVSQLFAGGDVPDGENPDAAIHLVGFAVGIAGVVHEHGGAVTVDDGRPLANAEEVSDRRILIDPVGQGLAQTWAGVFDHAGALADRGGGIAAGSVNGGGANHQAHRVPREKKICPSIEALPEACASYTLVEDAGRWDSTERAHGYAPAQWAWCLPAIVTFGGLLTLPAIAQQSGNQNSSSTQSNNKQTQQTPPAHKSAAQENPFPADASQHAEQQQSKPDSSSASAPNVPDAAKQSPSGQTPGDAAKENPFPEDVSKSAAAAAEKENDSGSPSASGASSSNSNPGGDGNPDADLPPDTGRRRLKKPSDKDIQSGSLAGEGRAQEDVRIGRFYLSSGNYKGAYGRFSEAVRMDPANVDAIYGLASAADGLHNKDEALTNYKLYLQIAPDGDKAKSAQKAIRALAK